MSEHYSLSTVSVSKWCGKCGKMTQHKITNKRVSDCIECASSGRMTKAQAKRLQDLEDKKNQPGLF